ncbi:MAG: MotA/TolQ/ExbB proton channel family protein [Proteobacteria bacterium]|jgi:biopolymer transport protein ExbB/TolQ|nr:MotA/TolQ/ExbB proton channel family protein [Pseudomonadota bacterium]
MHAVMQAFSQGGESMCALALILAVGISVFTVRFVVLFFKYNVNAVAFMSQIQKLVAANNIDRALKLCNAAQSAALPRVIRAGLERADGDPGEVEGAIEEAALEVVPLLRKGSRAFLGLAVVSACVGVVGAAIGLNRTFSSSGNAGPELDPTGFAGGVASSMYPLALGFSLAAAFILAHLVQAGVATRIADEIGRYSAKLKNMLAERRRSENGGARLAGERDGA